VGGGGAEVVEGLDVRGGDGFDGEGAGDAGAGVVDERLVVEGFFAGRFVVGDGFEGDVGTFLYSKPLPTPSLGWASL